MALYLGMSTIVVDNAPDKVALSTTTAPTGSQARFNRDNEFHFEHKQVNRYAVILHTPPPYFLQALQVFGLGARGRYICGVIQKHIAP